MRAGVSRGYRALAAASTASACPGTFTLRQAWRREIVGVSRDSVARHVKFKAKYDLPFALVSDEDGKICEAYGVWVEKSMYGRKYMGIERATFLIDGTGKLRQAWRKVKVPGHAEAVLAAARAL